MNQQLNFNIGDKICYEVEWGKKKSFRRGTVIAEHDNYYQIKVSVPAHKDSYQKTHTFIETLNKNCNCRAFAIKKDDRLDFKDKVKMRESRGR